MSSCKRLTPELAPGLTPSPDYFVKLLEPHRATISLLPFSLFTLEAVLALFCAARYGDSDWLLKLCFSQLLAVNMVFGGMLHFHAPLLHFYSSMILLPFKRFWLYATGLVMVVAGIALLFARTQVLAAHALVTVLLLVLPANVACVFVPRARALVCNGSLLLALLRLPIQALFIAWARWFTTPPLPTPF